MKQYTIVLEMPCVKSQTVTITAEDEKQAVTLAKEYAPFDSMVAAKNVLESPQVISITGSDKEVDAEQTCVKLDYMPPQLKDMSNKLVKEVAAAMKDSLHKCTCEKDPFYALLKSNDVGQRVKSAIKDGEMAMVNLEGNLEKKKYKITIKLEEVK